MSNFVYGIDVSHHNGNIDWTKVPGSNPPNSFVYVKATQGVGYIDPMCTTYAKGVSTETKMRLGYYHFASLNNTTNVALDATNEAIWFDKTMKTLPKATLPPMLDIETNANGLTPAQVQEWISAFLAQMNTLGYPVVLIYSYKYFLDSNLPANHPFGNLPLWLAQYVNAVTPSLPVGWTTYTIWQYSGSGTVAGVPAQCDLDKADPSFLA